MLGWTPPARQTMSRTGCRSSVREAWEGFTTRFHGRYTDCKRRYRAGFRLCAGPGASDREQAALAQGPFQRRRCTC
jgi:hypothetical protein